MTAAIACWTLVAIAFSLCIASISFASLSNKDMFDRYKHWVRPLLFLAGIAWLVVMTVVIAGAGG